MRPTILFAFLILAVIPLYSQISETKPDTLIVSIGGIISNGDKVKAAKLFNRVKLSDRFQLFVQPATEAKLYIFSSATDDYELLLKDKIKKDSLYYFPSENERFAFDGLNKEEHLIVVVVVERYNLLDEALNESSKLNTLLEVITDKDQLTDDAPKIINIGGNFRDVKNIDKFVKKYTGISSVSREYHFEFP